MLSLVFGVACCAGADALDSWFVRTSGTANSLYAATYGNSNFVAVGLNGVLLTSTNGSNWVSGSASRPTDKTCATYGNGVLIAAGGFFNNGPTNVLVSTNASSWQGLHPGNTADFYGASFAGGIYFLVGSSTTILTATNINVSCAGTLVNCNWTPRISGGNQNLGGAAYGNGIYVVVGDQVSMTSTDTITWATNFVSQGFFRDVAFGNGTFVAVGFGGVQTSSDGIVWIKRVNSSYPFRVTFDNGTFVAVGDLGTIITSTDGITWKNRTSPVTATLTGVTYGNGTFVVTGLGGTLLQSASVSVPRLAAKTESTSGGIALSLAGEIGRAYTLQATTNLISPTWDDVVVFTNTVPTMEFLDTSATNFPQRFYRAVSP